MNRERTIVLASASPRRRQLLSQLGVSFTARASNVNEDALPGESPAETQKRITLAKAEAISHDLHVMPTPWVVIASDTTVLLDGEMLNKPADVQDAWSMLHRLRGCSHVVQSCLVVLEGDAERETRRIVEFVQSEVRMRDYRDEEIAAYIATGDPFDKAGSYAVQHPQFRPVSEIVGCPLNVIGLSLCRLRMHMPDLPLCGDICEAWFGRTCADEIQVHPDSQP